jgi:hypothetical protein
MLNKIGTRSSWVSLLALIVGFGLGDYAQADPIYSYFYVAGQASYTAATDSDVQVPLYLQEVSSDSSSLLSDESGLFGVGVNVSTTVTPSSPASITALLTNLNTPPNGFDGVGCGNVLPDSASVLESIYIFDTQGVLPGPQQNGVSEVFLGTLTVHTGSIAGQTTTFTIGPYDLNSGNTYTNNNLYNLDNNLDRGNPTGSDNLYASAAATTFSISTAPVPEPSTIGLLAAGAATLVCLLSVWRKRRGLGPNRC